LLERHHAVDMTARREQWRQAGWQPKRGAAATAGTAPTPRPMSTGGRQAQETQRIPVVEEKVSVGKRAVERGGVRVYTRVTEQPVSEQVQLRQERVHAERHNADRAATPQDLSAFKEGTVEMRETSEEPVVQKQARVTGEVEVRKDVEQRTQTVRENVRRTDVKVENLNKSATPGKAAGSEGSGPGQFRTPVGVTVSPPGNIYVGDSFNNRVQALSPDGQAIGQWGAEGTAAGQLMLPQGVVIDGQGTLYVADLRNDRVQSLATQ